MRVFALLAMSILLLACAAPAPEADLATPPAIASAPSPQATPHKPAPPMSDPLPPERMPDRQPVALDLSCKTDADCTVKNVGNCCGAYPACVNKNSPTDPEGVQAQCAKSGMASVCGFTEIASCQCARGQCIANAEAIDPSQDPPAADPIR